MVGSFRGCCARAAGGQSSEKDAAVPPRSVMNARRLNSFNCILSLPAKAKLQDIELASISQQPWSWGRGAEHEGGPIRRDSP
jgi:hypothetical protein